MRPPEASRRNQFVYYAVVALIVGGFMAFKDEDTPECLEPLVQFHDSFVNKKLVIAGIKILPWIIAFKPIYWVRKSYPVAITPLFSFMLSFLIERCQALLPAFMFGTPLINVFFDGEALARSIILWSLVNLDPMDVTFTILDKHGGIFVVKLCHSIGSAGNAKKLIKWLKPCDGNVFGACFLALFAWNTKTLVKWAAFKCAGREQATAFSKTSWTWVYKFASVLVLYFACYCPFCSESCDLAPSVVLNIITYVMIWNRQHHLLLGAKVPPCFVTKRIFGVLFGAYRQPEKVRGLLKARSLKIE